MSNIVNWNASIQFPSDSCFTNRIVSAKFGPSNSSGNPMITLECEVVSPDTYQVGEQEINIAGVKTKSYFTTKSFNADGSMDEEKTAQLRARVFGPGSSDQPSLFEKLELNGAEFDPENPDLKQLEGLKILTQMSSKADEQRKTPTAEQIAKAKETKTRAVGDKMIHPKTGKPLVKYWPQIDDIFGVA